MSILYVLIDAVRNDKKTELEQARRDLISATTKIEKLYL
jgi:hypothetical protein